MQAPNLGGVDDEHLLRVSAIRESLLDTAEDAPETAKTPA